MKHKKNSKDVLKIIMKLKVKFNSESIITNMSLQIIKLIGRFYCKAISN